MIAARPGRRRTRRARARDDRRRGRRRGNGLGRVHMIAARPSRRRTRRAGARDDRRRGRRRRNGLGRVHVIVAAGFIAGAGRAGAGRDLWRVVAERRAAAARAAACVHDFLGREKMVLVAGRAKHHVRFLGLRGARGKNDPDRDQAGIGNSIHDISPLLAINAHVPAFGGAGTIGGSSSPGPATTAAR